MEKLWTTVLHKINKLQAECNMLRVCMVNLRPDSQEYKELAINRSKAEGKLEMLLWVEQEISEGREEK